MFPFKKYAEYYDILYHDKNYKEEVVYIENLIKKYSIIQVKKILDLGCGTGKHDILLSEKGFNITGVDSSDEMIQIARKIENKNLNFLKKDICSLNLKNKFDLVISLFHVASYQTTNEKLYSFFNTAYKHLNKNGLFVFDFWYGPSVLTNKPFVRIKRIETGKINLIRISEPTFSENENVININIELIITDNKTNKQIKEVHKMRYLFLPEINLLLKNCGFEIINSFKWMSFEQLNFNNWYGVIIAKK